jgi:hypothetical protein
MNEPTFPSLRQRRPAVLLSLLILTGALAQSPTDGVLVQPGTVTFSSPSQAPTWEISVSTSPTLESPVYQSSQPSASPTIDVSGVFTNNTTYYWGYRISYNSWDVFQGDYSFATSTSALPVPVQVLPAANAGNIDPAAATLTWNQASGATGYDIQMAENSYFNLALQSYSITGGSSSQYTYVGATCKEYWWRIRTKGSLTAVSAWSPGRRFYTQTAAATLNLKVALQGPLVTATMIMNEMAGQVPLLQPYTGLGISDITNPTAATTNAYLNALTGNNRIVDWIYVELRHGTTNVPLRKYALLLQRDGDVVTNTGAIPSLVFPMRDCKVAVRHRNHLGAMASDMVFPCTGPITLDFTQTTTTMYGTEPTTVVNTTRRALWSGDTNGDGSVKYTGPANDRDPILVKVGSTTPNNTITGYWREDGNLDITTKYTGPANDRDPILVNIGSTTPNNVRVQQLP